MKNFKQYLLLVPITLIGAAVVFAAAPSGGYEPNATLDPDCTPGDADCFVKKTGKFVDGDTATDAVYTDGNVGIGTTTPATPLDVVGSITASGRIVAGDGKVFGWGDRSTRIIGDSTSDYIAFLTDGGVERMRVNSGGNIGIGTTTPVTKLEIVQSTAGIGALQIIKDGAYNSEGNNAIRIKSVADDNALQMGVDSTNNVGYIQSMDPAVSWTTRPLVLQGNGGNIGVGAITTPQAELHVFGGVIVGQGNTTCDATHAGEIRFDGTNFFGCDGTAWLQLDN